MESSTRFRNLIRRYGFRIQKVSHRPDILSVQYMNKHLFTIPKRMYSEPFPKHTDMTGITHPDFFECEKMAVAWNMRVKRTDFLDEERKYEAEDLGKTYGK